MSSKLVRDNIPAIISARGQTPIIHTASDEEYMLSLNQKLQEEVKEFIESQNTEELADIIEVINAIVDCKKITQQQIEEIREKKAKTNGRFEKKIILDKIE